MQLYIYATSCGYTLIRENWMKTPPNNQCIGLFLWYSKSTLITRNKFIIMIQRLFLNELYENNITVDNGLWDRASWYFGIKDLLQVNSFNLSPEQIFFIFQEHLSVTDKSPCFSCRNFSRKNFSEGFFKNVILYMH